MFILTCLFSAAAVPHRQVQVVVCAEVQQPSCSSSSAAEVYWKRCWVFQDESSARKGWWDGSRSFIEVGNIWDVLLL